jgi:hypothetical protein
MTFFLLGEEKQRPLRAQSSPPAGGIEGGLSIQESNRCQIKRESNIPIERSSPTHGSCAAT